MLKEPKTMRSLAPKNWFQNDIEIQIRHVSPPVAKSITQLTLCQLTTSEVDATTTARQGMPEASRYLKYPISEGH